MFFEQVILLGVLLATYYDVKTQEIPNRIPIVLFLYGLFFRYVERGWFIHSISYSILVFILFFSFYKMGILGGGDVKMMSVIPLFIPSLMQEFFTILFVVLAVYYVAINVVRKYGEDKQYVIFMPSILLSLIFTLV